MADEAAGVNVTDMKVEDVGDLWSAITSICLRSNVAFALETVFEPGKETKWQASLHNSTTLRENERRRWCYGDGPADAVTKALLVHIVNRYPKAQETQA
tara:strand:+ start:704 stop:1000 length:297 start_codon:yes stop_codon:yes gene_type:complete